jgi:hypothetical protein
MSGPRHIPQHYMIEVKPADNASMYLDTHYGMGWDGELCKWFRTRMGGN